MYKYATNIMTFKQCTIEPQYWYLYLEILFTSVLLNYRLKLE